MIKSQQSEIQRLVLAVAACGTVGWLVGEPVLFIAVGFAGYSIWSLYQLVRTAKWLTNSKALDPPESTGLWGEVLDAIYDLIKRNRKEKKRLQSTINHLHGSFAALSDAVVMIDSFGNIDWCNASAKKLLGLHYPQDRQQQLVNLLRSPEFIQYFEAEQYDDPLELNSPVDSQIDLKIHITLFGKRNRILFARNVTKIRQVERIRKDFVANVSHELRTPLTVISGYLNTMEGMSDQLPAVMEKAFTQMIQQTDRMELLVKDLLLLSRLESVPVKEKQIPLAVCSIIESIRESALNSVDGDRTIHIDCQQSLRLIADADEIYSAFSNLIYNAARYTELGGQVWIRWWYDEDGAYFSVRDNGVGIDYHHISRLTERFYRVDNSRSSQNGGTGLGLAIVKHVLMRHEARLEIKSRRNEGSEFLCCFPLTRTAVDQTVV